MARIIASLRPSVVILAMITLWCRPAAAQLTITAAGAAQGFSLSTFATGFPSARDEGPLGIAFTSDGGVLVSDGPGNVRLFPRDVDGQNAAAVPVGQNYGTFGAFGLARVESGIYLADNATSQLLQLNADGTLNRVLIAVPTPLAVVANPFTGHLFVSSFEANIIYEVDPGAVTETPFAFPSGPDGLSLSPDGRTLYLAAQIPGKLLGYDTATHALVYTSQPIAGLDRGWDGVAGTLQRQLLERLPRLQIAVQDVLDHRDAPFPAPPLPLLLAELRQLHDEFEHVSIDLDDEGEDRIAITTDPIELEGLGLGPFSIELHLERMVQRSDSSAFRIVALDPNASERNEYVTHPHVSDQDLCAGDATVPIALALSQGRLCDAFVLVNSVLHTYNGRSAYVPIEEWRAITCPDCECTDCESLICCETCGREACDHCSGTCEVCERSCCGGCLEYDPIAHQACCSNCRGRCKQCNRIVVHGDLDEQTGLCPQCLAEQQPPPSSTQENPHEPEPRPQPMLAASAVQTP